jgi:type III secretion protein T
LWNDRVLEPFLTLIDAHGFQAVTFLISLTSTRMIGFCFGFLALVWVFRSNVMLVTSIGFIFSLPLLPGSVGVIEHILSVNHGFGAIPLYLKEVIFGFGLGLLSSLPFLVFQYAGAVSDHVRGGGDSGITDAYGGPITQFGNLFLIIAMAVFFSGDGFALLVQRIYESYRIWPLESAMPVLSPGAGKLLLSLLGGLLAMVMKVTAPSLFILVFIEYFLSIAARLAKRLNMYSHAFAWKNFAGVLMLPLVVLFVISVSDGIMLDVYESVAFLEAFLR